MRSLPLALLVLFVVVPRPADASPQLRGELSKLAKAILVETQDRPVSVGVFSPTRLPDANSAVGIEEILKEELLRVKPGSVAADAPFEVKGDYSFSKPEPGSRLKVIKIAARIIEVESTRELVSQNLTVTIDGTSTIAEITQPTASLPSGKDVSKDDRNDQLDKANKPETRDVHIHGAEKTLVSSTAASPYSVEILARPSTSVKAAPRGVTKESGLAFVSLGKGDLYEIRIRNTSDREVAVAVFVDGLDIFHFTQDRFTKDEAAALKRSDLAGLPKFGHLILQPKTTDEIVGWHNAVKGDQNYLSFLVTDLGKGAVTKAGIKGRGKVGAIHVQFSHCKPIPEGATPKGDVETGFGPPRKVEQKPVRYTIDPPHDLVTVRYTRP